MWIFYSCGCVAMHLVLIWSSISLNVLLFSFCISDCFRFLFSYLYSFNLVTAITGAGRAGTKTCSGKHGFLHILLLFVFAFSCVSSPPPKITCFFVFLCMFCLPVCCQSIAANAGEKMINIIANTPSIEQLANIQIIVSTQWLFYSRSQHRIEAVQHHRRQQRVRPRIHQVLYGHKGCAAAAQPLRLRGCEWDVARWRE